MSLNSFQSQFVATCVESGVAPEDFPMVVKRASFQSLDVRRQLGDVQELALEYEKQAKWLSDALGGMKNIAADGLSAAWKGVKDLPKGKTNTASGLDILSGAAGKKIPNPSNFQKVKNTATALGKGTGNVLTNKHTQAAAGATGAAYMWNLGEASHANVENLVEAARPIVQGVDDSTSRFNEFIDRADPVLGDMTDISGKLDGLLGKYMDPDKANSLSPKWKYMTSEEGMKSLRGRLGLGEGGGTSLADRFDPGAVIRGKLSTPLSSIANAAGYGGPKGMGPEWMQSLSPTQQWLLLGGSAAGLGGVLSGNRAMTALGGLAAVSPLLANAMAARNMQGGPPATPPAQAPQVPVPQPQQPMTSPEIQRQNQLYDMYMNNPSMRQNQEQDFVPTGSIEAAGAVPAG